MRASFAKIAISLLMVASSLAQSKDIAHCELASQQLKVLNGYLDTQVRIRAAQSLIFDIEELRPMMANNTSGLPDKLITLCFDLKRKAFQTTFEKGGVSLFGDFDFLMAAGKYFFYEKIWSTSHDAFAEAAKLRPNLFDPSYSALQAWTYTQLTAESPLPEERYRSQSKRYIDNMLKSKDIRDDERKLILGFLSKAEEKSSKIYTARAMLERSVALNPTDLKMRLQLGELEERTGRFAVAKKIYEEALALKLLDPYSEKQIYLQLTRLYLLFGDKTKLANTLKKAIALYPSEPYFLELNRKRLPANVKK